MALITGLLAFAILFIQHDLPVGTVEHDREPSFHIRLIPLDTLSDLAIAYADSTQPVIYYSPRLMQRYGPDISAFVVAHEQSHILLGHRRPSAVTSPHAVELLLQRWELEADCLAASRLARERPAALVAARDYFQHMGAERVDCEHPTGTARAARIEECGTGRVGN
ncbi:MAG TPA: hypothetical protein VGA78_08975 [Gemmatimonadales bacterium]